MGRFRDTALRYAAEVVTCKLSTSIQEAAQAMRTRAAGSIVVVNAQNWPLGIVTDTDLRNRVLATAMDANNPVSLVMSAPVTTMKPTTSVVTVQMAMMSGQVHHLVFTEDGTTHSPVVGVVSDHDVLLAGRREPVVSLKALRRAESLSEWRQIRDEAEQMMLDLVEQGQPIALLAGWITLMNDELVRKAIATAMATATAAPAPFCWLSLGSDGRREQLLRTDQDNAIVFEGGSDVEKHRNVLLSLAAQVNDILETCGFARCPGGVMARNPAWCLSLEEWHNHLNGWMDSPTGDALLHSGIFLDYRKVFGESRIIEALHQHTTHAWKNFPLFAHFLAREITSVSSSLNWLGQLKMEPKGEHLGQFDLKKKVLMPLAATARLLCWHHSITGIQGTADRFLAVVQKEPHYVGLLRDAAHGYELLLGIRAKYGLRHQHAGSYIPVEQMGRHDLIDLKTTIRILKEIQDFLDIRFQTALFR